MKQRKRQIDPDFFHDEKLAKLKPHTRLLFAGLWTLADRKGLLKDIPAVIKGMIFPHEEKLDVNSLLNELHKGTFIVRYKVDGNNYIWIRNFERLQSVHPHESKSVLPMSDNVIISPDISRQAIHGQYVDVDVEEDVDVEDKSGIPYKEIITDLNNKSGKDYKWTTQATKDFIKARWNDGYRLSDFQYVHDVKVAQWKGTEQEEFIRPKTLYTPSNFEAYRNQAKVSATGKPMTFDKTETCDHCHHEGAIVEDPDDVEKAKGITGKAVIFKNGMHHYQCLACGKKFERF